MSETRVLQYKSVAIYIFSIIYLCTYFVNESTGNNIRVSNIRLFLPLILDFLALLFFVLLLDNFGPLVIIESHSEQNEPGQPPGEQNHEDINAHREVVVDQTAAGRLASARGPVVPP